MRSFFDLQPRLRTLREVSPFRVIKPLENQEQQKEVGEFLYEVDNPGFDDVLSVDPGEVNGGACRECVSIVLTRNPPTCQLKEG